MTRIMRPILLHFWSAPIAISEILSKDWIVTETVLAIDEDRDIPSMTVLRTDHEDTDRRLKDSKDILPDLFHGYRYSLSFVIPWMEMAVPSQNPLIIRVS